MRLIDGHTITRNMEMKCLIPTEPDDLHADVVKRALEYLGHQVMLVFPASGGEMIIDNDVDIVWWRCQRMSSSCKMAPNAWWINSDDAARRANFKLLQLKAASDSGMTIPTTLCSNDPEEIRLFMRQHEATGVISLPLVSNQTWKCLPSIFQTVVKTQYELRVICFGHYLVAVKWHPYSMVIEPYVLPDDLSSNIRLFMNALGIVFGVCDFIVTPNNALYFLEFHEQGDFLWIEAYNPEVKMLDIFVNFLLSATFDFKWSSAG